ncbi:hypothetical protein [Streptomyces sp. NPDC002785]|uniref:hypothetical protein n=1 Tax=Streptomyces sp. NPDC002785 TaxID=3154543 RepID=UPI00331D8B4F
MDNDVSAGSTGTSALGHLALGLTLLVFGIGHAGVVGSATAVPANRPTALPGRAAGRGATTTG